MNLAGLHGDFWTIFFSLECWSLGKKKHTDNIDELTAYNSVTQKVSLWLVTRGMVEMVSLREDFEKLEAHGFLFLSPCTMMLRYQSSGWAQWKVKN